METGDFIRIDGLRLRTVLGVHSREREAPREVVADLRVGLDLAKAEASDDLADTFDWEAAAAAVRRFAEASSFRLAEALAGGIAALVLRDPRVRWVRVRLAKPGAVDGVASVAVDLFRGRGG